MKKLLLLITMAIATKTYSQTDSVYVCYEYDEMEDITYYYPCGKKLIVYGDNKNTGFLISLFIEKEGNNLKVTDLDVKSVGIGGCVENDEIIFLFEDGSKISLKSWNKFNCDGNSWFNLRGSEIEALSTLKIKKVKFQNGRTYESLTGEIDRKDYFIKLFYAINNNLLKKEKSK